VNTKDKFSPYLDPEPIAEFFDDVGQRGMVTGLLALLVHVGIFIVLQLKMPVPHIPDEIEPIQIKIISFAPEPEPELESEPDLRPAAAPPSQTPTPKPATPATAPTPKPEVPKAEPIPTPPPPPEPEPEPEPMVLLPAQEIINSPTPEPDIVPETPPEPEPEPEPKLAEPLDLFDPALLAQSEPELAPEPISEILQAVDQPVQPPQPVAPLFDPNLLDPDSEPNDLSELEDVIELPPAPVVEPLAPPPPIFEPEVLAEPPAPSPPDIDLETIPDIEIAAPPPTILASPDAPTTQDEVEKAVLPSQATPLDFILKDRGKPGGPDKRPTRPTSGGGNEGNIPIAGGTPKTSPGAGGWQLPSGLIPAEGMPGGKGLIRDIRCREEQRDHEDCPEYINKHRGRNVGGLENFGPHVPLGTSTVRSRGRPQTRSLEDKVNPTFGDASLPSSTVLDDVGGFRGQYRGDKIGTPGRSRRVRDLFNPPDPAPWTTLPDLAPPPKDEQEDEPEDDEELIILPNPQ